MTAQAIVSVFAAICVITAIVAALAERMQLFGVAVAAWIGDAIIAQRAGLMEGVPVWAFLLAPFLFVIFILLIVLLARELRRITTPADDAVVNPPYKRDKSYRYSKQADSDLIEGAALAEQRANGRERGAIHHVYLTPGHDPDTRSYARWLEKHGTRQGVILHVMDKAGQELHGSDRQYVLKKGN